MAKKKLFILKQSHTSELQGHYIDNHANNLQFAIQSTILILKLLSIGARIVPLVWSNFQAKNFWKLLYRTKVWREKSLVKM